MTEFREDIHKAIEVLRSGGIILYPCDTDWGMGCDASNPEAVNKLFELLKIQNPNEVLVLLENPNRIISYVEEIPEVAWDLIDFAEKPLTIIHDGAKNLAKSIIAPDGSIAIRITAEEFSQSLCQRFRKPLVFIQVNNAGKHANCFHEIPEELKSKADYIVEYRQDERKSSAPASIIKLGVSGLIKIIKE